MGLGSALRIYSERFSDKTGIIITVNEDSTPIDSQIIRDNLFRIFQEAISNVAKHSGGRHIWVILQSNRDKIVLEIKDDGKGFDLDSAAAEGNGIGLSTMKERASLLGGVWKLESKPGTGTIIRVEVGAT